MVAYLNSGLQVRTYSDYLRATQEAEKEDSMELPWGLRTQTTNNPPKSRATSFFTLRKLKGNQPIPKMPVVHLAHFEEEDARGNEDEESDHPSGIKGVMEEFMVHLARAVKDAQIEEKHCYHCSSPKHFIHNCLLIKTSRENKQLYGKKGTVLKKGAQTPSTTANSLKNPRWRFSRHKATPTDSLLESRPLSALAWVQNVPRVRISGESCMALLDIGAQINTIMPKYVSDHLLQMGLITNLLGAKVACVGLGNAYMRPLGYVIIRVPLDGVQGYDEDQIALVILDLSNFVAQIPVILGTPTYSHIINVMKEMEIDVLAMPCTNTRGSSFISM